MDFYKGRGLLRDFFLIQPKLQDIVLGVGEVLMNDRAEKSVAIGVM